MENEANFIPLNQPTQEPAPVPWKPKIRPAVLLIILGVAVAGYFVSAKFLNIWPLNTESPVSIPTFTPRPAQDNQLAGWQKPTAMKNMITNWTIQVIG